MIHTLSGIGCILLLLIIAYEDFKDKAVHAFLFLLSFAAFLINSLSQITVTDITQFFFINIFFSVLIFAATLLYFLLKDRMQIHRLKDIIGTGDLLFIFTLAVAFAPVSFILFLIGANILIIILHLLLRQKRFLSDQIPWAGWMSVFLIITTLTNLFGLFSGLNDYIWIKWIMN